jgi:ribosome biogenesis GTPase
MVSSVVEAVITAVFGELVEVGFDDGRNAPAFRARSAGEVVVGDRVVVEQVGAEGTADSEIGWRVAGSRDRERCLWRSSRRHASQLVVANVDRLVIVTAVDPAPRRGLIDRYLVAAESQDITAVLVLNKNDLNGVPAAEDDLAVYRDLGYELVSTSGLTGDGIDTLGTALSSGLSVLVGHSGVGKSTLLNRLVPAAELRTRELSLATGKGRHTTSVVTAHRFRDGILVDTPGIREFGLVGIEPGTLIRGFREFSELGAGCRFSDCAHQTEPGCAVRAAVEEGRADAERYASYLRIRSSLEAGER